MSNLISVTFRHVNAHPALEARVFDFVACLGDFCDSIATCHVDVEAPSLRPMNGGTWSVKVMLTVFGHEIIAMSHRPANDDTDGPAAALSEAFEQAKVKLDALAREQCVCTQRQGALTRDNDSGVTSCGTSIQHRTGAVANR